MNKFMIRSPAIFFTILAYWLSGSVVMGSKNDDVAKNILFIWRMKFWFLVRRWMILIISTNSRIYTIFHPYITFVQSLPIHFWQKYIIRPKEVGTVLLTISHALLYLLNVNL
jgi:hypothetical protein